MNEWEEFLRVLCGSLLIIVSILCLLMCVYKYAVCQEKKEKNSTINVIPRQYTDLESKHNSGVGIVVSSV